MKIITEEKIYDTDKCQEIFYRKHENNGNYCGSTTLIIATDSQLLLHTDANGQDLYLENSLRPISKDEAIEWLENAYLSDDDVKALIKYGLAVEV